MALWSRLRLQRQPDGVSPLWGIGILLLGIVLVLLGYLWEGTWEDVFIEVGAASGVGGIVMLFKPRLMRQVDELAKKTAHTTAEKVASTKAEGIERRLVKLESINDIQANERDRLQGETERIFEAVGGDISFASVNELLDHAANKRLFADYFFIRTSDDGQTLFEVSREFNQFDPDLVDTISFDLVALTYRYDEPITYARVWSGQIRWADDQHFADFVTEVFSAFTRANMPYEELSLEKCIQNLQDSYKLMDEARKAPQNSNTRLSGSLVLLINDEWALTDVGLEATGSSHLFRWYEDPGYLTRIRDIDSRSCPEDCQPGLWEEAKFFATNISSEQFRPSPYKVF